jgi:phospholipase C
VKLTHREAADAIAKISVIDPSLASDLPRKISIFIDLVCESEEGIEPVSFGAIAYFLQLTPAEVRETVWLSEAGVFVIVDNLVLTKYRYDEMKRKSVKDTEASKSMV